MHGDSTEYHSIYLYLPRYPYLTPRGSFIFSFSCSPDLGPTQTFRRIVDYSVGDGRLTYLLTVERILDLADTRYGRYGIL